MTHFGLGVMLRHLQGGTAVEDKLYTNALGKTISAISIDENVCVINFADGTRITFTDEGQSCCENRYMTCDDELDYFIGAQFTGAELKDGPEDTDNDYECHDIQFLEIQTNLGVFTIANHNEHNGYYGGFAISIGC